MLWVLAAAVDDVGNLAALRQTNIVRMLAYSSIAQGGFMLVPFAAAGIAGADGDLGKAAAAMSAVVIYLLIYGAMNLGAFAVVIAVAAGRAAPRSRSYAACSRPRPASRSLMTIFLLARRHPAARGLVRQVRDVPVDHRRRAPAGRSRSASSPRSTR